MVTQTIRVLVVDDSSFYRSLLAGIVSETEGLELVGTAVDPFDARGKIKELNPDVVTLDVEMPGMDGIAFLEKIMTLRPMPVIMVSTLTAKGTDTTIRALEIGAVDCVVKPVVNSDAATIIFADELITKIKTAAGARLRWQKRQVLPTDEILRGGGRLLASAPKLIAIGSSTGGVETLTEILIHLPKEIPPIIISQHMPPGFTAAFATRLDKQCEIHMIEATDGLKLASGIVALAPGGKHLKIAPFSSGFQCVISDDPPVNNHKPSVDVMFDSVNEVAGRHVLGIILTGMGRDGAAGLLRLKQSGAHTIGQDKDSSVVYGMPQAAMQLGAVERELPLSRIAKAIVEACFGS